MKKITFSFISTLFVAFIPFLSFGTVFTTLSDGDWHTPATWGVATIAELPTFGDTVIINGHSITLTTTDVSIKRLEISNTFSGVGILDVNGDLTLDVSGNIAVTAANYANDVQLILRSASIVNVGANLTLERTNDNLQNNKLELKMYDSAILDITGALEFNYKNSGSGESDFEIYLAGSASLTAGASSSINQSNGKTVDIGIYGSADLTFLNDFSLNLSGGQNISMLISGLADFNVSNNLTLSNSGGLNELSLSASLGGDIIVGKDLIINSLASDKIAKVDISNNTSTLDVNGNIVMNANSDESVILSLGNLADLYLAGGINRVAGFGALTMAATAELYFDGSDPQVIPENKIEIPDTGNDSFYYSKIVSQNSSVSGLSLAGTLIISEHLDLNNGILTTSNATPLIIANDATISTGSSSSYIDGPLVKRGSTKGSSFVFPVGDNGTYAPLTIEEIVDGATEYTVQYIGCPPPLQNSVVAPLESIHKPGYWEVNRNGGLSVGNIILGWDDADARGINDLNSLVVARYLPLVGWYSLGRGTVSGGIGSNVSGAISNDIGCPPPLGASIFTLGSTDIALNVLPVEFIGFNAYKTNNHSQVILEWETASEENSDYFVIEKSSDGVTFQEIGRVPAAQNSTTIKYYSGVDNNPEKGNNYYRIQQVDQSQLMTFSSLKNIFIKDQEDIPVIYPNPVDEFVRVYSESLNGQEVTIKVLNLAGHCLYTDTRLAQEGQLFLSASSLNINNPGIYFLSYEDQGEIVSLKFMKLP